MTEEQTLGFWGSKERYDINSSVIGGIFLHRYRYFSYCFVFLHWVFYYCKFILLEI